MSIPWPTATPSLRADVSDLLDVFENTPDIIVAWHTLVGDLLQSKLSFKKTGKPAPSGYITFVSSAVKSIMITGVFFWKKTKSQLLVAHPLEVDITDKDSSWQIVVVFPPTQHSTKDIQLASPVHIVRDVAKQLNRHRRLFLDRDILNSRPACFISVSEKLQNNGHPKPWFRSQNDYIDNFEEDLNIGGDNVSKLVRDRAQVIEELGSETHNIRKKRRVQFNSDDIQVPADTDFKEHSEHIVTDGYDAQEARALQSLSDNLNFVNKLAHQMLTMLKVPPAAIGANINSERLASSSQLVARSLIGYHAYVNQLQNVLSRVFETIAETEDDEVYFKRTLTAFELQQVAPFLKEKKLLECTAVAYNIPKEWFDIAKFATVEPTEKGGAHFPEQNEINKAKHQTAPPPKSNAAV